MAFDFWVEITPRPLHREKETFKPHMSPSGEGLKFTPPLEIFPRFFEKVTILSFFDHFTNQKINWAKLFDPPPHRIFLNTLPTHTTPIPGPPPPYFWPSWCMLQTFFSSLKVLTNFQRPIKNFRFLLIFSRSFLV